MTHKERCILRLALAILLLAAAVPESAWADKSGAVEKLNVEAVRLYELRRYDRALAVTQRALALAERLGGPDHPDVVVCLQNLTNIYAALDRLDKFEPVLKRLLSIRERTLPPEHPDIEQTLDMLALVYVAQDRASEAEVFRKRSLALREKLHGADHPDVADGLHKLADIYRSQGRHSEAEPLLRRALAIREKALGPEHADVADSLHKLANAYSNQGRYSEAEPLFRRVLAIREKVLGPDHPDVAESLHFLAEVHRVQGRYPEAESLVRRALAINEGRAGGDLLDVARSLNNLATIYGGQGRYREAEPLYTKALSIRERALGTGHPAVATTLSNLGHLNVQQGRFAAAERLYRRSLDISEKALGRDHTDVGVTLNNLADLYESQGRYAESESLFKRAVAIFEKARGAEHPDFATSLDNLAGSYASQERFAEAEPIYKRSLAIREKALGPEHPSVGHTLNNLADLYQRQERYAEAEPLLARALGIFEQALGPEHRHVGTVLRNMATTYRSQGRGAEAEQLLERSLAIQRSALGPDHPDVAARLNDISALYIDRRDWAKAASYLQQSTDIIARRSRRGVQAVGTALTGKVRSDAERAGDRFRALVRVSQGMVEAGDADRAEVARRMFQTAQWGQSSEAAQSLAQMAARQAANDDALAHLVRQRQDVVAEWQAKDMMLIAARAGQPARRDAETERQLRQRLVEIDKQVAEIDAALSTRFPSYAALVNSDPPSVEEVQAALRPDEALLLFLDAREAKTRPEETFIWLVTKTDLRWVRSELGRPSLAREVAALRCGLDYDGAWSGSRCTDLTGQIYTEADHQAGKPLPFDLVRAHKLYQALFGELADQIRGKHLLVVPSGPLTQLPFHVLVTQAPDPAVTGLQAMRQARWLLRDHAVTVLPAASSLTALRRDAKASRASNPYLGIGNPLLDGPSSQYARLARLARDRQSCATAFGRQVADIRGARSGAGQVPTRGGVADAAHLRIQAPLPETAGELCAVARHLGASGEHVRLGAQANELLLKRLSETGALARYRILHFATHGTLAGEIGGGTEPGLILTPPKASTEQDDGYLSASEVANLRLDADWVILSACNTAAGNASSAEALSGLARAFFYAGTRALLVSHGPSTPTRR